ncbi:type II secretion system F family protein [Thiomicrospira sp.]|uniref:type II secretion system F family protein n=1 Tax=Thiomicrospira sp. TaxID=935 RepID=UPI002F9475FB
MELGFFLVALSICLPFLLLIYIHQTKQKRAKQEAYQLMFNRIGLDLNTEENANKKNNALLKLLPIYIWLQSQLKQAGLVDRNSVVKLLISQAILTFISVYVIVTKLATIEPKSLVVAILLPLLPSLYIYLQQRKRQNKIKAQFPEMLDTLVRALQSGYGIDGALNMVANEFPAPLGKEIKEVNSQLQLGISMRDILREFQRRITLSEAQYFVVTLIIQRETGGQLVEILSDLSKMMRRRERFQAKLKSLTAESRFTAFFIGGAPLVYLAYKVLFQPQSMTFFFNDPTGQVMFWGSLILMVTGMLVLRSMLKIRF